MALVGRFRTLIGRIHRQVRHPNPDVRFRGQSGPSDTALGTAAISQKTTLRPDRYVDPYQGTIWIPMLTASTVFNMLAMSIFVTLDPAMGQADFLMAVRNGVDNEV